MSTRPAREVTAIRRHLEGIKKESWVDGAPQVVA